jgi:vacuolar protein sorting-associated protein 45
MLQILTGMKALLLDATTTKILSMVYSQTQILEQEVYLVEQIGGKSHEAMPHLKAAVFVQPTFDNLEILKEELRKPKFAEYHIFFSNIVPDDMLSALARADEFELVKQVNEYYADYMAINEDFYQLSADNSLCLSLSTRTMETKGIFERNVQGILSSLLASKRRPSQIRYQAASNLASRIATEVHSKVMSNKMFEFPRQEGPMLLILDRRDDPITPLLTQWTYQAMVHELLGLKHNRVILKGVPNIQKDLEEIVLSCSQDKFFAKHRYDNFGDLGAAVKELLDEYQKSSKSNANITTIKDMQAFMDNYPEFRAKSINASKHVAVMSRLGLLIDECHLLDISSLEQEIACSNDHSAHKKELLEKIANSRVQPLDKLRLALLYVIRYEGYNEVREIKSKLMEQRLSSAQVSQLDSILEYAGESKRAPGLFTQGSIVTKFSKVFAQSVQVENVYTQHQPILYGILDSIVKGKLKDSSFPQVSPSQSNRPSEVFVFIVGGTTYEEAAKVAEFNKSNPSMRVILGGSCVHNSTTFMHEISKNFGNIGSV